MALIPGTRFGSYEITAQIGVGGMGEVYRARDSRLDRDVAIKVLPEAFAQDAERLARFDREAKTLAALNHPGIAHIYGIEDADRSKALVMELVEGPTLADRIAQGPVPVDEALAIARQIGEALEAAHEQGIVHRDLKPANVKVRPDGTVKVLDFGLAKTMAPSEAASSSVSMSPTITTPAMTQAGLILGTAAYMSPEQAKGRPLDRRSDVWAFGAVLFEMLGGRRAFEAEDVSETLAAVLMREPDWSALPATTPAAVTMVLRRCLQKNPKHRMRDIGDVVLALDGAFETIATQPGAAPGGAEAPLWRRSLPLVAAAIGVLGVATGIVGWTLSSTVRPMPVRFSVLPPDGVRLTNQGGFDLVVSPDGARIAYLGETVQGQMIYVRELDEIDARPLPGTEGAEDPFFSPDGNWIGFESPLQGGLMRVRIDGGQPLTIHDHFDTTGATWGPDESIVYADGNRGLFRVNAGGGGTAESLVPEPSGAYLEPHFLPSGEAVVFSVLNGSGESLRVLSLATGEERPLLDDASNPYYASGYLLFARGASLMAVRFDAGQLRVEGEPFRVLEGVRRRQPRAADYALARNGTLVYVPGTATASIERRLFWVGARGEPEALNLPARAYEDVRVSPDGTRVAATIENAGPDGGRSSIWVGDARGSLTPVTFDTEFAPLWTPDGRQLVYSAFRDGNLGLYRKSADGAGEEERLVAIEGASRLRAATWSPDGDLVFEFVLRESGTGGAIGLLSLDGEATWDTLLDTPAWEFSPAVSPNGRWLAYASNASDTDEVYVERFPEGGDRRQISIDGGINPAWSADGRTLFYLRMEREEPVEVVGVAIEPGPPLVPGSPEPLFDYPYRARGVRGYDLEPGGERFLVVAGERADPAAASPAITVVVNWLEELESFLSNE